RETPLNKLGVSSGCKNNRQTERSDTPTQTPAPTFRKDSMFPMRSVFLGPGWARARCTQFARKTTRSKNRNPFSNLGDLKLAVPRTHPEANRQGKQTYCGSQLAARERTPFYDRAPSGG